MLQAGKLQEAEKELRLALQAAQKLAPNDVRRIDVLSSLTIAANNKISLLKQNH